MFINILKEHQPVVYQTLYNSLKNNKLAHAFLFTGVNGTPKKETALLLAQSLVCEHADVFACEKCDACQRIHDEQYSDLIVLDGSNKAIKKEDILNLQEQFAKTALEKSGHKIYIIDHAENATAGALNSLLKFLEEPSGTNTNAILITESADRLLPTIVSRCQVINFRPQDAKIYYDIAVEDGIDELDAHILSNIVKDSASIKQVDESEEYQVALAAAKKFIDTFDTMLDDLNYYYQTEVFVKDKEVNMRTLKMFINIVSGFLRDVESEINLTPSWYEEAIKRVRAKHLPIEKIMLIVLETGDRCNNTANLPLLIDQMVYRIKEVLQ